MSLDDLERNKLCALSRGAHAELDVEAQARIANAISAQGPGIVHRARVQRRIVRIAGASAALLVLAWVSLRSIETSRPAPVARKVPPSAASTPPIAVLACATRAAISTHATSSAGDAVSFQLDSLGAVAAESGTQLWIDTKDPCSTRVKLHDGRVNVHAQDLGGGDLRVVTRLGEVVVHGTVFAVELHGETLVVDVVQGRVSLERAGRALAPMLTDGQRARMQDGAAPTIEALPNQVRDAVRGALQLDGAPASQEAQAPMKRPVNTPPAPDPEALLAEADALWRAGEQAAARERYRRAGNTSGATSEAAWLMLARRELSAGDAGRARAALRAYEARFKHGRLMGEALGISFRTAMAQHDAAEARRTALLLQKSYARTPQAEAAMQWLRSMKAR